MSPAPPSRGGTPCLQLRDALGTLYSDADFADLFPTRGQPAEAPWRLALVTVLQFLEGLADRQAADAVRSRLDWKYALQPGVDRSGFDHTVLSEFRTRLVQGDAAQRLLDVLLEQRKARGWRKARGRQRTDATHVLAAVRALNRLEVRGRDAAPCAQCACGGGSGLAAGPSAQAHPEWVERSGRRIEEYRLPNGTVARQGYAEGVGQRRRGRWLGLLRALEGPPAPTWLRELPRCRACSASGRSSTSRVRRAVAGAAPRSCRPRADAELARRPRRPLREEAGDHLGRLQGASHRDLRPGSAASAGPGLEYTGRKGAGYGTTAPPV